MARMRDGELVTLGPWTRGANNVVNENAVPRNAFRQGVNVDIYPNGRARRRKGRTLVEATPSKNGWSDNSYAMVTSIDGRTLYRFMPGQPLVQLYTGFALDADLTYCSVNHLVYVSDGKTAIGVNTTNDEVRPWGVPRPAGQPALSAVDGALDPGIYQVAITLVRNDGEEGGTPLAASINLPNGGGIRAQIPAFPVTADIASINLFLTPPNGADFQLYDTYPIGAVDVVLTKKRLGRPLYTLGLDVMPAGRLSTMVGGRLLVAIDDVLFRSESNFYGQTNWNKYYIPYSGKITMIAAVSPGAASTGVFVAAGGRTYFLEGDLKDPRNQLAYNDGAVFGAAEYVHGDEFGIEGLPPQPLPMWLSKSGIPILGLPNGQVLALTNGRYETRVGDRVSMATRELAGISQVIAAVRSPGSASVGVSSDSADTVLIRNGIEVP